ncbi:MAG: hypothetical protein ACJAZO_005027 [Myxococcota bacterium]|jgi:hypothetical protein
MVVGTDARLVQRTGQPLGVFVRDAPDAVQAALEERVGLGGNPGGGRRLGRPTGGRVVLESAVLERVVGRREHNAVGQTP